jgi:hypothetical protein
MELLVFIYLLRKIVPFPIRIRYYIQPRHLSLEVLALTSRRSTFVFSEKVKQCATKE